MLGNLRSLVYLMAKVSLYLKYSSIADPILTGWSYITVTTSNQDGTLPEFHLEKEMLIWRPMESDSLTLERLLKKANDFFSKLYIRILAN